MGICLGHKRILSVTIESCIESSSLNFKMIWDMHPQQIRFLSMTLVIVPSQMKKKESLKTRNSLHNNDGNRRESKWMQDTCENFIA